MGSGKNRVGPEEGDGPSPDERPEIKATLAQASCLVFLIYAQP